MTVLFLTRYTRRPLHLFGFAGLAAFILGAAISLYLAYQRIFLNVYLSNRPLLFLGILLVIVGVQFISIGLIGEMIAATAEANNPRQGYNIKREVGFEKSKTKSNAK
jgi:dolichol-phosphate mannosyltransferase